MGSIMLVLIAPTF